MSFSNTVAERSSISASIRAIFGVRPSAPPGRVLTAAAWCTGHRIRPTLPQVFSRNVIVNIAGTCRTAASVTVTCDRAVPEESRGGPINYSDAD